MRSSLFNFILKFVFLGMSNTSILVVCLLHFLCNKGIIPQQKRRVDLMKSYKVTEIGQRENYLKKFKGIMKGNSEINMVSSMFSL